MTVTTGDNSNYSDIPIRLRLCLSVWVVSVAGLGCGVLGSIKDLRFVPSIFVALGFGSHIPLLRAIFLEVPMTGKSETLHPGVQGLGFRD